MAHLLGAEAVHLAYPTQVVFEAVTLGVNDGARIGIVGRNGDGKSSLLGLLTGQLRPDSGRVTRRSGLRVNALSQTDTLDPNRTVGWTLIGDHPNTNGRATRVSGTWSPAWYPTSPGTPRSAPSAVASADGCNWPACWSANGT